MAKTFIRFQLQTQRTNKNGMAPVKVVYELQGKLERKAFLTDKKIRPENWQAGKAHYLNKAEAKKLYPALDYKSLPLQKDIDQFNHDLADIERELRSIEKNLLYEGKTFTIADVLTIYKERNSEKPQIVPSKPKVFITDFIDSYVSRNGGIVNKATLQTYTALNNQLKAFQGNDKITFTNLDRVRLDDLLKHYVKNKFNNSTTSKHFSNLKKMLRIAIAEDNKLEVNQAFRDYTPKILSRTASEPDVIVLEQDEFNSILNLDLSDYSKSVPLVKKEAGKDVIKQISFKTLDKVKNLFIFSCSTGFRYSDMMDLKWEHIQDDWIIKKQVKGGKTSKIEVPLNPISRHILSIYEGMTTPLPTISNQKANDYVKLIGDLAGIKQKVEINTKVGATIATEMQPKCNLMSMHMGRRVFISLTLEKGVGMQDVMSLSNHKKFASFKRYFSISKKQKEKAMSVWRAVENKESNLKAI
ncbi:phage integrase SAM-like domain-containing protein [Niabella insulamsoli]|uniref:phage integrase SAM-like domain-containing protein n=1 Tax=Niabella insulamsoli TaxID=3144874 RepID=UPI0031FC4216